jgi:aryl-alcohol dehydrogenase-like predicted oxidoreductase
MMREIGRTGIKVVPIGLGAMPLSIEGRPGEADAFKVIEAFVKLGGNFIDTANVYCLDDTDIGHNERLIHRALTRLGEQDRIIVATKGGLRRPQGRWVIDGDPAWIRESCEKSLKDLHVDAITLYQLHAVDPEFGWQPSVEALVRLREEGKIRHIGLSNVSLDTLRSALAHAPIQSVQNRCNPFAKDDFDNGMIEFCRSRGISYIPHSPVGGHSEHRDLAQNDLLQRLATKYGASAYCIALAWLLAKGGHFLPIPGASRVASVEDSMRALNLRLDPADIQAIDALPDKA